MLGLNIVNEEVLIDVSKIKTELELHQLLKEHLEFPDFYGLNWDAFWDVITGCVELPQKLIFVGWQNVSLTMPIAAKNLKECLNELNSTYPTSGCDVEYK